MYYHRSNSPFADISCEFSPQNRRRAEYGFGEYGFKRQAQWVFLRSPSSGERTQWVPLSLLFVWQNELTEFVAELTEFAPKLSEAQWVSSPKQYSARFLQKKGVSETLSSCFATVVVFCNHPVEPP